MSPSPIVFDSIIRFTTRHRVQCNSLAYCIQAARRTGALRPEGGALKLLRVWVTIAVKCRTLWSTAQCLPVQCELYHLRRNDRAWHGAVRECGYSSRTSRRGVAMPLRRRLADISWEIGMKCWCKEAAVRCCRQTDTRKLYRMKMHI
eukprot:IDg1967t1